MKGEIHSIINLATTVALTTVEKIPSGSDIVKKVDYNAKILEMENKYFTTSDYSNFARNTLDAK